MIRIVNLRSYSLKENEVLIKVDRSSILGNPFYMKYESMRNTVCEQYDTYFKNKVQTDDNFMRELNRIKELAKTYDIALACWCYPKRCHAETIKTYIEQN